MPKKKNEQQTFQLKTIKPLTKNQDKAFKAYSRGDHLLLHGFAGTGKTFIAMYLALQDLIVSRDYDRIIVIRSVVPSRDIGFLPGSVAEKIEVYESPYVEICTELYNWSDAYDRLKKVEQIEFTTTSYLRGLTFNRAIVIVDEVQNMNFQELDTIMTRMGNHTRFVFCGDFRQTDFKHESEKSGLGKFFDILDDIEAVSRIEFFENDIVRSGVVKDYILAKTKHEQYRGAKE